MSSSISITVGNVTATLPVGAGITDAKVAAALTRYATSLAIPTTGTAQENLAAVLASIVADIKQRSKRQQVAADTATAQVAITAQADNDNAL